MFPAGDSVSVGPVATNALVFSVVSSACYTSKPKQSLLCLCGSCCSGEVVHRNEARNGSSS